MSQEKDLSQESKNVKRIVAKKALISDLINGTYIKRTGWQPNAILTKYGEIGRVNIIGTIVSVSKEKIISYLVDDGSSNIMVRIFDSNAKEFAVGDMVNIIGRPREWESLIYLAPEVISKINNKNWFKAHLLQIKLDKKTSKIVLPIKTKEAEKIVEIGPYQNILNSISLLDKGNGVDVGEIVNNLKIDNCEQIIDSLVEEGEIFEISPGRVKLLE